LKLWTVVDSVVTGFIVHDDKPLNSNKWINLLTKSVTANFSGKNVKSFRSGGIFTGSKVPVRCGLQSKKFRSRLRNTDSRRNKKSIEKLDDRYWSCRKTCSLEVLLQLVITEDDYM
jgi:hypothetical protein